MHVCSNSIHECIPSSENFVLSRSEIPFMAPAYHPRENLLVYMVMRSIDWLIGWFVDWLIDWVGINESEDGNAWHRCHTKWVCGLRDSTWLVYWRHVVSNVLYAWKPIWPSENNARSHYWEDPEIDNSLYLVQVLAGNLQLLCIVMGWLFGQDGDQFRERVVCEILMVYSLQPETCDQDVWNWINPPTDPLLVARPSMPLFAMGTKRLIWNIDNSFT